MASILSRPQCVKRDQAVSLRCLQMSPSPNGARPSAYALLTTQLWTSPTLLWFVIVFRVFSLVRCYYPQWNSEKKRRVFTTTTLSSLVELGVWRYDNLRCHQRRQNWHHHDSWSSVHRSGDISQNAVTLQGIGRLICAEGHVSSLNKCNPIKSSSDDMPVYFCIDCKTLAIPCLLICIVLLAD